MLLYKYLINYFQLLIGGEASDADIQPGDSEIWTRRKQPKTSDSANRSIVLPRRNRGRILENHR